MIRRSMLYTLLNAPAIDSDAQAYFTAANIVLGQVYSGDRYANSVAGSDHPIDAFRIIDETNRLIVDWKAAGLWNKTHYMYPFLGTTLTQGVVNLINPGVKDLVPSAGNTFVMGRSGVIFDGSGYFSSGILLSEFGPYSYTGGYYHYSLGGSQYGVQSRTSYNVWAGTIGSFYYFADYGQAFSFTSDQVAGLNTQNILANNLGTIFAKGVKLATTTIVGSDAGTTDDVWVGAWNSFGTPQAPTNRPCGMFFMCDGLSDSENTAANAIIERWAFGVGRNTTSVFNGFQFVGDSITIGLFCTPVWHCWATAISYYKNASCLNYGVSGHTIVDCDNIDILNLVNKDVNHTRIAIAYSTNDVVHELTGASPTMNLSIFTAAYSSVLNKVFAAGFSPDDIFIISGYWNDLDALYPGGDALQDTYINAVETLAASFGITRCYNLKPVMLANGGNALLSGIHPNSDGHDVISTYLNAALGTF